MTFKCQIYDGHINFKMLYLINDESFDQSLHETHVHVYILNHIGRLVHFTTCDLG